ncbi:large exoprotein, partial [Microbacterium sp. NE1TT3]|nr:large exoprotein [Microbacterium thalli]
MARARRRARLTATVLALLSLAGAGLGVWVQLTAASATLLWASGAVFVVSVLMLQQMSRVARRATRRVAPVPQVAVQARQTDVQ